MYAFNKRFRATKWKWFNVNTWMLLMGAMLCFSLGAMLSMSSRSPVVLFLFIPAGLFLSWQAIMAHINAPLHRVLPSMRVGKLDMRKKEFFE